MTNPSTPTASPQMNDEQSAALRLMSAWLNDEFADNTFVLSGAAGTGKTFCIRALTDSFRSRLIFTAPTNKATKVLRDSVTSKEYQPECRTIYSLLGLRLEASGEVKELTKPEDPIDLSKYKAVVVDEGSMVNRELMTHILETAARCHIKFLFLGDAAQLPPVGEIRSPIWDISLGSQLTKVMRHDNQILELATRLRGQVDKIAPTVRLASNNSGTEGIWRYTGTDFDKALALDADAGAFSKPSGSKAIAWRNVEVDRLNRFIRGRIFKDAGTEAPWLVGDRVLFAAPARDIDDEPMASTDDEGEVTRVDTEYHYAHGDIKIWRIAITLDDNRTAIARVLHPDSQQAFARKLDELSAIARTNSRKWKDFWQYKDAFHSLRHAYAITAHRSQGSTYDTAFVNWQDILLNKNRQEAYRCLYVACTRPKRALILS